MWNRKPFFLLAGPRPKWEMGLTSPFSSGKRGPRILTNDLFKALTLIARPLTMEFFLIEIHVGNSEEMNKNSFGAKTIMWVFGPWGFFWGFGPTIHQCYPLVRPYYLIDYSQKLETLANAATSCHVEKHKPEKWFISKRYQSLDFGCQGPTFGFCSIFGR